VIHLVTTDLLRIINTSLLNDAFPSAPKTAVLKPLLKKNNLDASILNNYRPMSNLPFIGKIIERNVLTS